ncbi:MAG: hypothetical protein WCR55_12230 [Lentisphaerota bacterium]
MKFAISYIKSSISQIIITNNEYKIFNINDDCSVNLFINSAPWRTLVRWILSEAQNIKVINPKTLADEIKSSAQKIANYIKIIDALCHAKTLYV